MNGQVYVAARNDEVKPNDGGDPYYQCSCGAWNVWGREAMLLHFRGAHDGMGRFAEDSGPLEEMIDRFRRQVRREALGEALGVLARRAQEYDRRIADENDAETQVALARKVAALSEAASEIALRMEGQ